MAQEKMVIESGAPLPRGGPASLWFFAATLVVFLLQIVPDVGIFLMFLGAGFWSVVLINLGMGGIIVEVVKGKVRPIWLVLPLLYFGLYGLSYAYDRWQMARVRAEVAAVNGSKPLPYDPARQDLVIKDDFDFFFVDFIQYYAVDRVFSDGGRLLMIGKGEVCNAVSGNSYFNSAGIHATSIYDRNHRNLCRVSYPATADRPVVEVQESSRKERRGWLSVALQEITLTDSVTRRTVRRQWGSVALLEFFPKPMLGCGLADGGWECGFAFTRDSVPLVPAVGSFDPRPPLIASALGIVKDDQPSRRAVTADLFFAQAAAVVQSGEAKESALIEKMIAQPTEDFGSTSFSILYSNPDKIVPLVPKLVEVLGVLQSNKEPLGYYNGEAFWSLLAAAPDDALAPYRPKLISWLMPEAQREWTKRADTIFKRLDASDPVEREILLDRLEGAEEPGDIAVELLYGFCRMGVDAPSEVKERMFALWRKHGTSYRLSELYFTLARMGLKDRVGKPKSPGTQNSVIWERVGPEIPAEQCPSSERQDYEWDSEEQRYRWKTKR